MLVGEIMNFIALFLGAFVLTYVILPKIIGVVTYKRLMDNPNSRSSHNIETPSLGGIAFFISIILGMYFLQAYDQENKTMALVPGTLILFIVGLKDDLVILSPFTKVSAQLISITFVLLNPCFQIHNLHGFLGFNEVSLFITIPLSVFVMLFIINSYNLIDGIDGLAALTGIVIFSSLGVVFGFLELKFFMGICIIMIGSLLAFLRYNISTNKKIFMGDTGSLIIGFFIASGVIRLFATPRSNLISLPFYLDNLPLIVMSFISVPLFDTTRIFTLRVINGKKPFSPDRNHIHHLLIDYLHFSHKKASFLISLANILFILFFIFLSSSVSNYFLLVILVSLLLVISYFFFRINFSYSALRKRVFLRNLFKKSTK